MRNTDYNEELARLCSQARSAAKRSALHGKRGEVIERITGSVAAAKEGIIAANAADLEDAEAAGLDLRALGCLRLDAERLDALCGWLLSCARLPDMAEPSKTEHTLAGGGRLTVKRAPLGAIAYVYDCRPDMTLRAATASILTRNAAIMYGGTHSARTDAALMRALRLGLEQTAIDPDCAVLVDPRIPGTPEILAGLCGIIDVLISNEQRGRVSRPYPASGVPVIITATGKVHMYLDHPGDAKLALRILSESVAEKKFYEGPVGTVLVHKESAGEFFGMLAESLDLALEYHCCPKTREYLPDAIPAVREDWTAEYEEGVLGVKVVSSVEEAISHIRAFGTGCCECIVSLSQENIEKFRGGVSAAVLGINAPAAVPAGFSFDARRSRLTPTAFFPGIFPSLLMTERIVVEAPLETEA